MSTMEGQETWRHRVGRRTCPPGSTAQHVRSHLPHTCVNSRRHARMRTRACARPSRARVRECEALLTPSLAALWRKRSKASFWLLSLSRLHCQAMRTAIIQAHELKAKTQPGQYSRV